MRVWVGGRATLITTRGLFVGRTTSGSVQRPQPLYVRQQRALGQRPDGGWHIVVGQCHPVVQVAVRRGLHCGVHLGFTRQAVVFELGDGRMRLATSGWTSEYGLRLRLWLAG